MAQFKYDDYVRNYEIDYFNDLTANETILLSKKLRISEQHIKKCFFKSGGEWCCIVGGMTFNIKDCDWYPIMKKHLDKEFERFIRKEKLKQIDDRYCR